MVVQHVPRIPYRLIFELSIRSLLLVLLLLYVGANPPPPPPHIPSALFVVVYVPSYLVGCYVFAQRKEITPRVAVSASKFRDIGGCCILFTQDLMKVDELWEYRTNAVGDES